MKRKIKHLRKEYKMPHVFLNDLEEIERILVEAKVGEYTISTTDFEYKELAELPRNTKPFFELSIQSHEPYISLDLSHNNATLYAARDDIKSQGIFSKIDQVLIKTERKVLWFFIQFAKWGIGIIIIPSSFVGIDFIKKNQAVPASISLFIFAVSIMWWLYSFRTELNKFSLIEIIKKDKRVSFIKRNKDQILLILFGAIIGALITFLLNFFLR